MIMEGVSTTKLLSKEEFKRKLPVMDIGQTCYYKYIGDVIAKVTRVDRGFVVETPYWSLGFHTTDLVLTNLIYYH